jgi:hypothetical protein
MNGNDAQKIGRKKVEIGKFSTRSTGIKKSAIIGHSPESHAHLIHYMLIVLPLITAWASIVLAEPILKIQEKDHKIEPSNSSVFDPRRTSWISEIERTKYRLKRKTGVELDVELAKSLCRTGSLSRCEEALVDLQQQVTSIIISVTSPPTPPNRPINEGSVIILTKPTQHYHHPKRYDSDPTINKGRDFVDNKRKSSPRTKIDEPIQPEKYGGVAVLSED